MILSQGFGSSGFLGAGMPSITIAHASIAQGVFDVTLQTGGQAGVLSLYLTNGGQAQLTTMVNQSSGIVHVNLDDVIESLKPCDLMAFSGVLATWRSNSGTVVSASAVLDYTVMVLADRLISNYFTPTLQGNWDGEVLAKGMYPAGNFPDGLRNIQVATSFLNSLDPANEGLGMDGGTVIRDVERAAVKGFPQVTFLKTGAAGYIENPSQDQQTAGGCGIANLRASSVAVRTDAFNLACGDRVYIPGFGLRTVDDHGTLEGNQNQIDVWIGTGDQSVKNNANNYGVQTHTALKIL